MISAFDGELKGNDAVDIFHIRIWTEDGSGNETTVYDNESGVYEKEDPTTTLGGGSIIIHNGNNKQYTYIRKSIGEGTHMPFPPGYS